MKLGFVEDFTTDVQLDRELQLNSKTGVILNSGVHPSITLDNLLQFLPFPDFEIKEYQNDEVYNQFSTSRNRKDLILFEGEIFECLVDNTQNVMPEDGPVWLKTNRESLILKSFIQKVKDKIISDLKLSKRLVNSQYLYQISDREVQLPNDYAAWVFEAKGSDYVSFTINEISAQILTDDPVNLYVINQGILVDTLILHPQNGKLIFEKINYSFSGKGQWIFAINSQRVHSTLEYIDQLKYDGFICYTASGIGDNPTDCVWTNSYCGNGLGFNISVTLESDKYIEYNFTNFTEYIRSAFELLAMQSFLHNSNNRSNRNELKQREKDLLMYEVQETQTNTVAKRYYCSLKDAQKTINKTFDTQLGYQDGISIYTTSV